MNLRTIQVKRMRQFGKPYLALALWRRLQLHRFFEEHLPAGRERIDWDRIAFVLSCGRFCEQASELALAERWYGKTALEDLIGIPAEKIFSVEVQQNENGRASGLVIEEDERKAEWAGRAHGAYLLRTNCLNKDPKSLWRWYIQLTQAEEAFRRSKSDLGLLRPVFHQIEERVQAHILICFLTLVMWRSLSMWLCSKGLGDCPRQLLLELDEVRSMDIIAEIKNDTPVGIRVVGKPDRPCAILLQRLGLKLPTRPKIIQNVVEKNQ